LGSNRTVLTIDETKASCAAWAAKCYRMTIQCSDGQIVRDFEPNEDGELVANLIPAADTRANIDEMLGPEGLMVIGTDDNSINWLDGTTPGGHRLDGVIGKIVLRKGDGSPGRSYFGNDLAGTLTTLLTTSSVGDKIEVWGEVEYPIAESELAIDIADGVTLVNH